MGIEVLEAEVAIPDRRSFVMEFEDIFLKRFTNDNRLFLVEKEPVDPRFKLGHRYILTPYGLVRIEGSQSDVWKELDDSDFLDELDTFVQDELATIQDGKTSYQIPKPVDYSEYGELKAKLIPFEDQQLTNTAYKEISYTRLGDSNILNS